MIREEVVWALKNLGNADHVAANIVRREGYEVVIQHVMIGEISSGVRKDTTVAYLVVERKVEE
jgi:hypothetical protein